MGKVMASETSKKGFRFLGPVILAIVFVLSLITVARSSETGMAPPKEEMQTEKVVAPEAEMAKQAPAEGAQRGMSESGKSGDPEAKDESPAPAKDEATGGSK